MQRTHSNAARSALRRAVVSAVNWSGSYAREAPRFRRIVLGILSRIPALSIRLRQMRIESQLAPRSEQGNWSLSKLPTPAEKTRARSDHGVNYSSAMPACDGVNARQRTPLEAHFRAYRDIE